MALQILMLLLLFVFFCSLRHLVTLWFLLIENGLVLFSKKNIGYELCLPSRDTLGTLLTVIRKVYPFDRVSVLNLSNPRDL